MPAVPAGVTVTCVSVQPDDGSRTLPVAGYIGGAERKVCPCSRMTDPKTLQGKMEAQRAGPMPIVEAAFSEPEYYSK